MQREKKKVIIRSEQTHTASTKHLKRTPKTGGDEIMWIGASALIQINPQDGGDVNKFTCDKPTPN